MMKKVSSLLLAGMIALPATAMAAPSNAELEDRISELESMLADMGDSAETWNEASRFDLSGDFRFRADMVAADAPSFYQALDIARGINDVLTAGGNFVPLLSGFGLDPNSSSIGDMMTAVGPMLSSKQAWDGALVSSGFLSQADADTLWAIFSNQEVQMMLQGMAQQGAPLYMLTGSFANAESLTGFMKNLSPAGRKAVFSAMGYSPDAADEYVNDTTYTNRFRLNLRVKAMENIEFKARLGMYKVWGMQNNTSDYSYNAGNGGGPFMLSSLAFDGTATRQPKDAVLRVDRAFMNWNAIGGAPVWFSIGRRPVTDGPPAQLRMGADQKMATPVNYMDYPFDGLSLGYAYEKLFGMEDAPGRVRFCFGRGFESGPNADGTGLDDVDFGGISWDVYSKGDRFFNFQSFGAFNMFNVPDNVNFVNPLEFAVWEQDNTQYNPLNTSMNLKLDRENLGNIFHTSTVYMSKYDNLNYFLTAGWSHTDPRGKDEMGTSLLGSWWAEPEEQDGYSVYAGIRYDIDDLGLKLGAEYNWGSQYWISFTPGHDDLYAAKLSTRGTVAEVYAIYDLPAGDAISRYAKAFMRFGFQHYDYEYTGSGFWLGEPLKIDDLANDPLNAQFYVPVDTMDQVYVTMEAWF